MADNRSYSIRSILGSKPRSTFEQQNRAEATIRALRDRGRYGALLQDSGDINLFGANTVLGGAMGAYDPTSDALYMAKRAYQIGGGEFLTDTPQNEYETTVAHELTHGLHSKKRQFEDYELMRRNPRSIQDSLQRGETYSNARDFANLLNSSPENYSKNELGARFASELGYGNNIMSPIVREAYEKYPGISMLYAQKNMQPNRPFPVHYKSEIEWTPEERTTFEQKGKRPYYSDEELIDAQNAFINALRQR